MIICFYVCCNILLNLRYCYNVSYGLKILTQYDSYLFSVSGLLCVFCGIFEGHPYLMKASRERCGPIGVLFAICFFEN